MSKIHFETSLEKLARILARQYNINVVFEGNQASTDGKTITLPSMDGNLSDELRRDLSAFLDHEVAHCKFTEFPEIGKTKNRFHRELLNATEDVRIERLMGEEFPGAELNLRELNDKLVGSLNEKFHELPWPVKIIVATSNLMQGRTQIITDDIKEYVPLIEDYVPKFNEASSTSELTNITREMMQALIDKFEKDEKEDPKTGKAKSGSGMSGEDIEKAKSMMGEEVGEKKSEFDEHIFDIHGMMDEKIKKEIKESKSKDGVPSGGKNHDWTMGTNISVPVTTKYDKVNDMVGKGNSASYAKLKAEVMPLVSSIKNHFEKVLKVKENAHWKSEREQGVVNAKALARLATDKNYRYPFKEFKKTDTKNVAVEILVDMSGSMGGEKIKVAKMSAIAMAEALSALDIPFEVTGFTSVGDSRVSTEAKKHTDLKRFNRFHERLELFVFKDFNAPSLIGIEKMEAMSNNPDGECVKWAANRLINRKEKRKILIVLSDGMPAADGDMRTLNYDLKSKVQQIMKSGIECVGLGVLTDAVKHFYPDHVVIKDLKTLPSETMSKLCKIIAR
jgi:cobalamin biosynthesis protein CobT